MKQFGFVFFVIIVIFVVQGAAAQTPESIAEIRVHGNHTTPDADILNLAGLAVGAPATPAALAQAAVRLRASDRFDAVEVRRRYRSIANPSEILVILLVDERAAVTAANLVPGPLSRLRAAGMWMPILHHRDGYGLTYGARLGFVGPLGPGSRLSVPMTWGAERRAGVEVERTFNSGPLTLIRGTAGIQRRVNPHYSASDMRNEVTLLAERVVTGWLRAGATGRVSGIEFDGGDRAWHHAIGGRLTLDTRIDPSFPRNAVHATVGWERVTSANRVHADLRGYVGLVGPVVLALRGQASRADRALPFAERPLLGGGDSLRGYRAGHQAGDSMAAISGELRVPLTSPLNFGRFGVKAFADAGTTWLSGERLRKQQFDRGAGVGIYFGATAFSAGVDVAWPERGQPRIHVGLGVSF
jgi:outer membrane protein assembly factor BamA